MLSSGQSVLSDKWKILWQILQIRLQECRDHFYNMSALLLHSLVPLHAEISSFSARKAKANLQDVCIPKLEKLARRGKNLSKDASEDRAQKAGCYNSLPALEGSDTSPADCKEKDPCAACRCSRSKMGLLALQTVSVGLASPSRQAS